VAGLPSIAFTLKKENAMFKKTQWLIAVAAVSTAMLAGCGSDTVKPTDNTPPPPPPTVEQTPPPVQAMADTGPSMQQLQSQHSVYFDLDKSDIKPEGDAVISTWAKYLSGHGTAKVQVQGNCDERGTREYNSGLGERRGNAVAQSLEAKGVSPSQVSVISYGKERPVCSEHKETCWSQNRRGDLVLQ
jgi:peptidoglycan-associated lipoprotein